MVPGKQPEAKSVKVPADNIYRSWGSPNADRTTWPNPGHQKIGVHQGSWSHHQRPTDYSDHVTELIATCSRTLYAIRTLKAHGLIGDALHTVFKATVQARLLYCAPAWSGYCTAADRDSLESFLRHSKRLGYCDVDTQSVVEQFQLADETLFERVLNVDRLVFHSLLPSRTEYTYNLRRRRHDYELIPKTQTLNIYNFIMCMLYKNSYWHFHRLSNNAYLSFILLNEYCIVLYCIVPR